MAAALRVTDPALLHYRSGAFYLTRACQAGRSPQALRGGLRDVLLGVVAAAAEPIAGGRHKVFGRAELAIIPQTSTIASHLPRAVGLAFAAERGHHLPAQTAPEPWRAWSPADIPDDAIVVSSFGDASVNHSTAAGAFNTAAYCAYQGLPLPLLLVCEDNGIGISVRTPPGWVRAALSSRPGIAYFHADGSDLADVYDAAAAAAAHVRQRRAPAFLHLSVTRLGGHAGSDAEAAYRSPADIADAAARDPLLGTARLLIEAGAVTADEVIDWQERSKAMVLEMAAEVADVPRLTSAAQVMAPLAPRRPTVVAARAAVVAPATERQRAFAGRLPEDAGPLTLAQSINAALADALAARPGMLVFGEDVARKGGVYGVTRGLLRRFGAGRVFDTPLDEQAILGLALGAGLAGMLPVPEIQYLAYLHNAADQIRGEAATLVLFFDRPVPEPAGGAGRGAGLPERVRRPFPQRQRGRGAARHPRPGHRRAGPAGRCRRDAADLPGRRRGRRQRLRVPRTDRALSRARRAGTRRRRLAGPLPPAAGRPGGRTRAARPGQGVPGAARPSRPHHHHVRQRAAAEPARRGPGCARSGTGCRVVDLRWIAPLPVADILREAAMTGRVLIADETRHSGGVSEAVVTALADGGFGGHVARVTSEDSFIPLGDAAGSVLLSEQAIESAARDLLRRG